MHNSQNGIYKIFPVETSQDPHTWSSALRPTASALCRQKFMLIHDLASLCLKSTLDPSQGRIPKEWEDAFPPVEKSKYIAKFHALECKANANKKYFYSIWH